MDASKIVCWVKLTTADCFWLTIKKNYKLLNKPKKTARPAAGRIVRVWVICLDIVRCSVKFRYYLKFHGARTSFERVDEGKKTSAGYRAVPGRCPAGLLYTSGGHRTILVKNLNRTISKATVRAPYGARPGIVRCLTSARNFRKSLRPMPGRAPEDSRPGTGGCPYGHRSIFMSRTANEEKRRVFTKVQIAFT